MLERKGVLAAVAAIVGALGCAGPPPGFRVAPSEARDEVDVVAIARPSIPFDVEAIGDLRAHLEELLTHSFESAGLRVVSSEEWEASWRQSAKDVGGIYDAKTGEADDSKFEIVRDAVHRDLVARHAVDAVAHLAIEREEDFGTLREVATCGRWVPVYWPGGWRGGPTTFVRVACLHIFIVDRAGRMLYALRTALEVTETYGHQTRAVRGPGELFRDRDALAAAVERIVTPFIDNERDGD